MKQYENVLLFKNGKLDCYSVKADGGLIREINKGEFDPSSPVVLWNLSDCHTHAREPGLTHKEDIDTICEAARHGGISNIFAMPNTKPVCDDPEIIRANLKRSENKSTAFHQFAAISIGLLGKTPSDYAALKEAGACGFSDDGQPVYNDEIMAFALKEAKKLSLPVVSHCEEKNLVKGPIFEGEISSYLGLGGIPDEAESVMVARDAFLAAKTDSHVHIAHVSTKKSFDIIRKAKAQGVNITCETCPHYFILTDKAVLDKKTNAKMNPPLASEKDRLAVLEAISDKTCDILVTDHAPHTKEEKCIDADIPLSEALTKAPFGIIGLQTLFASSYTHLVKTGIIDLKRLYELLSLNPAKIFNLETEAKIGSRAAFSSFDLNESFIFLEKDIKSKSKNSPFINEIFYGKNILL